MSIPVAPLYAGDVPAAPPISDAPPVAPPVIGQMARPSSPPSSVVPKKESTPEEQFLAKEMKRVEQDLKARANGRRYFLSRELKHSDALIKKQLPFWNAVASIDPADQEKIKKVATLALVQMKITTDFLRESIIINVAKFKETLPKYTLEEIYILLAYLQEIWPGKAKEEIFRVACEEVAKMDDKAPPKRWFNQNKAEWESVFTQHPDLAKAMVGEIQRRATVGIVVIHEPRPYSAELAEEKGAGAVDDKANLAQAAAAAIAARKQKKGDEEYVTLRPQKKGSTDMTPPPFAGVKLKPRDERTADTSQKT